MKILTACRITEIEEKFKATYNMPETLLMENAAFGAYSVIAHNKKSFKKAAILCGYGNNGGDGLALARKLFSSNIETHIFFLGDESKFSPSALINYNIIKNLDVKIFPFTHNCDFTEYDIIVDAILGTGRKRPISGLLAQIIDATEKSKAFKLAIDIPSGITVDKGFVEGVAFKADATVTFSTLKLCHTLYPAKEYCGKVYLKNITIPDSFFSETPETIYLDKKSLPLLKKRQKDSHKGTYGHVAAIGGEVGKAGAVYLSALSSLKIGAGLVTAIYPANSGQYIFATTPEIMTRPENCGDYFIEKSAENVINFINTNKITNMSIGNGIGRNLETVKFIKQIINKTVLPIVIDADGLWGLEDEDFKKLSGRCIITPHLGEFARITNIDVNTLKNERINIVREFTIKHNIITVLKSAETIICNGDGNITISGYGSPALAKGGSGDCLAGITAGFMAQGYNLTDSAKLACYTLGRSGEIASENNNEMTVLSRDIINNFSTALNEL